LEEIHQTGYDLLDSVGASGQMPSSCAGESVYFLSPAAPLRPGSSDQPFLLQPVENRIEGSVSESKEAIAVGFHVQSDLVPVLRFFAKRGEDEELMDIPGESLGVEISFAHGFNLSSVVDCIKRPP
jgi:hypothetical protein